MIRTREYPNCYLCGSEGKSLYEDLQDYLFFVKGKWSFSKCKNIECGLLWINPIPLEADIHKAYEVYYTHVKSTVPTIKIKRIINRVIKSSYDFLTYIFFLKQFRRNLYQMYLSNTKPGRLLEVGCGSGERLAMFRDMGWSVEGQEVDSVCVKNAFNQFGLEIQLGELNKLAYENDSFDAIILNHVIEHVHEPLSLLTNCHQLLKNGGVLIIVTPNNESSGLKYFRECWRGFEPPRHIHIFNIASLKALARKTGFNLFSAWSTAVNAETISYGSLRIYYERKLGGRNAAQKILVRVMSLFYQILFSFINLFDKNSGEECVLKAIKS